MGVMTGRPLHSHFPQAGGGGEHVEGLRVGVCRDDADALLGVGVPLRAVAAHAILVRSLLDLVLARVRAKEAKVAAIPSMASGKRAGSARSAVLKGAEKKGR